jgi:hypothetical protein
VGGGLGGFGGSGVFLGGTSYVGRRGQVPLGRSLKGTYPQCQWLWRILGLGTLILPRAGGNGTMLTGRSPQAAVMMRLM